MSSPPDAFLEDIVIERWEVPYETPDGSKDFGGDGNSLVDYGLFRAIMCFYEPWRTMAEEFVEDFIENEEERCGWRDHSEHLPGFRENDPDFPKELLDSCSPVRSKEIMDVSAAAQRYRVEFERSRYQAQSQSPPKRLTLAHETFCVHMLSATLTYVQNSGAALTKEARDALESVRPYVECLSENIMARKEAGEL